MSEKIPESFNDLMSSYYKQVKKQINKQPGIYSSPTIQSAGSNSYFSGTYPSIPSPGEKPSYEELEKYIKDLEWMIDELR